MIILFCSLCDFEQKGYWFRRGETCPDCRKGVLKIK